MLTIKVNDSVKPQIFNIINDELRNYQILDSEDRHGINFIVPESVKASVEREVIKSQLNKCSEIEIDAPGNSDDKMKVNASLVDGDVLSFIRLGVRILEMSGTSCYGASNEMLLRNVIYRILVEHQEEFIVISRLYKKLEYVDMLIQLLGDLVRYNIRYPEIEKVYLNSNEETNSVYQDKIHDLYLLMKYIEEYNQEYGLGLLVSLISQADKVLLHLITHSEERQKPEYYELMNFIRGEFIFIGFGVDRVLTPEENSFVIHLSQLGARVNIYPLADGASGEENDNKIYYYGNKLIDNVVKSIDADLVDDTTDAESLLSGTASLSEVWENYIFEKEESNAVPREDIVCTEIKGVDDRIAYIANEIIELTRNQGYRYKDIRIVCVDDELIPRMKSVLETFGLDGFIDRKIVLNNTPVLRYVRALLDLPLRGYDLADVLVLMRTYLLMIPAELIDLFENYAVEYNLTWMDRIFNEEFYKETSNNSGSAIILGDKLYQPNNIGEFIWKNVVSKYLLPVYSLCQKIINAPQLSDKARILAEDIDGKRFLISRLRDELLDRGDTDGAAALVLGYREMMSLLTSLMNELNNVEISLENFNSLIRIDMSSKSAGTIPLKVDSIEITNPKMCFLTPCRVMFIIGAEENNFPYTKSVDHLMTGNELRKLFEASKVEYQDKAENKNRQEYVMTCLLLNSVSDKFYYVHEYGKTESSVYSYLKRFVREQDINYNCFKAPIYGNRVERRHIASEAKIDEKTMLELLQTRSTMSVSSLESYNTCQMKYMLDKVLRIRARNDGTKVEYNLIGTLAHSMLENMFMRVKTVCSNREELRKMIEDYQMGTDRLNDLIDESYDYALSDITHPDRYTEVFEMSQGLKVKRIAEKAFVDLLKECSDLDYLPTDFELKIQDLEMKPEIVTDNGAIFNFKGSIDRVDARFDASDSVRIIDYKTGHKKIDYKGLLQGTQIQLFTYAKSLKDNGYHVDNVGYSQIGLSCGKESKLTIATEGVEFGSNKGQLTRDDFETLVEYAGTVLNESCEDISKGMAQAKVCFGHKEVCQYCAYSGICGNSIAEPMIRESRLKLPEKKRLIAADYIETIKESIRGNTDKENIPDNTDLTANIENEEVHE